MKRGLEAQEKLGSAPAARQWVLAPILGKFLVFAGPRKRTIERLRAWFFQKSITPILHHSVPSLRSPILRFPHTPVEQCPHIDRLHSCGSYGAHTKLRILVCTAVLRSDTQPPSGFEEDIR